MDHDDNLHLLAGFLSSMPYWQAIVRFNETGGYPRDYTADRYDQCQASAIGFASRY